MSINEQSGSTAADLTDFEAESPPSIEVTPDTVPDKFKGKTVEDLIKIALHAERKISQQGADLAAQRRISDRLLEINPQVKEKQKPVERSPVTVESLLNDPDKALRSVVESSDVVRRADVAEERVSRLEAMITQRDFEQAHTSYKEDLNDPEFLAWKDRNEVRKGLADLAARNDFRAAKSLWDMWAEVKEIKQQSPTKTEIKTKKVPVTVKSTPGENHNKRTFSRAKLMELRMKVQDGDPAATARWKDPEFQRQMIKAYEEDRVR